MLYIPKNGHMWDTSIIFHNGKYYLFSMFCFFEKPCINVWCAQSDDGVHFKDVGTVISDQPGLVWKMFVHRFKDQFVMNYGSFSNQIGHGNDTLRFWTSKDLLNWTYCGINHDAHPDPKWYRQEQRFDHMYTVDFNKKYYGFVVANPKDGGLSSGCGMMESNDGITWTPLPPVKIEWGNIPPINFEVGGCEKINDKYYLIGGAFTYFGNDGYAVFTFVADSPLGPFRPCLPRFRLCGNSHSKYSLGRQWLASFAKGKNGEALITNYITAETSPTLNFIGTKEKVWFLPMKKAIIGSDNELAMGYWANNDLLKSPEIKMDFSKIITPSEFATIEGDTIVLKTKDCSKSAFNSNDKLGDETRFVYLNSYFDNEKGVILEGNFTLSHNGKFSRAVWGILLGQSSDSTLISIEVGDPRTSRAQISIVKDNKMEQQEILDVISNTCAGKNYLVIEKLTSFRLFVRHDMFELYLDDVLVQTYTLKGKSNGHIGFYVNNCTMKLTNLKSYQMNLDNESREG